MNKTTFVLLFLVGIGMSLKISHLGSIRAVEMPRRDETPQPAPARPMQAPSWSITAVSKDSKSAAQQVPTVAPVPPKSISTLTPTANDTPAPKTTTTTPPIKKNTFKIPSGPSPFLNENSEQDIFQIREIKAFRRLQAFVRSDKSLLEAVNSGAARTDKQAKKLYDFMIKDQYFQSQIINDLTSKPENRWMLDLSKDNQLGYLRFLSMFSASSLQNPGTAREIGKKVLYYREFAPALKKQYGQNLPEDLLRNQQATIKSSVIAPSLRLQSL